MEEFSIIPRKRCEKSIMDGLAKVPLVVVTGVRRCGKSCIGIRMEERLRESGGDDAVVIRINFETISFDHVTAEELSEYIRERIHPGAVNYLLLDEVTHVRDWKAAVNEWSRHPDCKLVLFSSNRRVLTEDLDLVREGQYRLVQAMPLSLEEFIQFQEFTEITPEGTPLKQKRYRRYDDREFDLESIFLYYISYGGLPIMKPQYMDQERARVVLDGSYSAVVTHDVLEIGAVAGASAVTDPVLLRSVITVLAQNTGSNLSANWVRKQTGEALGRPSSTKTIESYMRALLDANLFYLSERFDIRSGSRLKTLARFYMVDAGIHNLLTGIRTEDMGKLLEDKVYFELLRREYEVCNGKIGQEEVDFVAFSGQNRLYIQVAEEWNEEVEKKKAEPLRKIRDHHPKILIVFRGDTGTTPDGIRIWNALEFLAGQIRN